MMLLIGKKNNMITVINRHHNFYIGRGSPLGNPFVIRKGRTRDEVIARYKTYLNEKIKEQDLEVCKELNKIYKAAKEFNVTLECFCKGFAENCHGDVIKEIIEQKMLKAKRDEFIAKGICPDCKGHGCSPNSTEQDHYPCYRCKSTGKIK